MCCAHCGVWTLNFSDHNNRDDTGDNIQVQWHLVYMPDVSYFMCANFQHYILWMKTDTSKIPSLLKMLCNENSNIAIPRDSLGPMLWSKRANLSPIIAQWMIKLWDLQHAMTIILAIHHTKREWVSRFHMALR